MLYWSGSGMIFNADCSGDVEITVESNRFYTSDQYGIYFTVFVDGVMQAEDLRIPKENNNVENWTRSSEDLVKL